MNKAEKRLADIMSRRMDSMFLGAMTSTVAEAAPDPEPLTLEKLTSVMNEIRTLPPMPKLQFAPDHLFPQDHYADDIALIPHHPAHQFFAKLLNPEAPTATVMRDGQRTRPDGTCFDFDDTLFIPNSFRKLIDR